MRTSCEVMIYIDLAAAMRDGFEFYVSANNVVLCPGDEHGFLPPKYFRSVVRTSDRTPVRGWNKK
jgi:2'-phosphotransferase